jgi:hypothetical protein
MADSDNPMDQAKPFIMLVVIAIVAFAGYYGYTVMHEQYTVNPDKIYARTFSEDPKSITDLTGDGTISGDYDYWVHFRLVGRRAQLIKESDFKEEKGPDREVARRWFTEKLPDTLGAKDTQRQYLKFFHRVDSTTANISHEWLLYNWRTDDHYYRKFGY